MEIALPCEFQGDERRPIFKEKRVDSPEQDAQKPNFQEAELADCSHDKPLVSIDFHRWILYNWALYELAAVRWPHTHGAIFWWDPTGALNCPGGATVAQSICNRQVRGSTPLWGSLQRLYPKKPAWYIRLVARGLG